MTTRELRQMLTEVDNQNMTIKELRDLLFAVEDQDAELMGNKEAKIMYSMKDYRAALDERGSHDMESPAWKLGQMKVQGIVTAMVASGNTQMVQEVVDEVYSLNDCGVSFEDEAIQFDLWLLESNGYTEQAQELRELDWK